MRFYTKWFVCVSICVFTRKLIGVECAPGCIPSRGCNQLVHPSICKEEADGKSQVDVRACRESGIGGGGGGGTAAATVPPLRAACQSHQPESTSSLSLDTVK